MLIVGESRSFFIITVVIKLAVVTVAVKKR